MTPAQTTGRRYKVRRAKLLRTERGMSQYDVFKETGIWPSRLSRFERGEGSMITYNLLQLSRLFQTTIDELLEIVDDPQG